MRINTIESKGSTLELLVKIEKTHEALMLEEDKQYNFDLFQNRESDAGYDVRACIPNPIFLAPWGSVKIPTGLKIQLETPDWEIEVRSRSGLAAKHNVFVLNSPGTIDFEYRDEIHILLSNFSSEGYFIQPNERIAQLCFRPIPRVTIKNVEKIEQRDRGGFGSSGKT